MICDPNWSEGGKQTTKKVHPSEERVVGNRLNNQV
jgi:hypothetical protein